MESEAFDITLTEEVLWSPSLWGVWRKSQLDNKISYSDSLREVAAFNSDIATIRAALICSYGSLDAEQILYIKKAVKSGDVAIRSFAFVLMVISERPQRQNGLAKPDCAPAIHLLKEQLKLLRASDVRTDFSLEVQTFILYNLSELYRYSGNDHLAMQAASEAIYTSLPLQTHNLTATARMSYALSAIATGNTRDALSAYQDVQLNPQSNYRQRLISTLNIALINLDHGDYKTSLTTIEEAKALFADKIEAVITDQFIKAVCGLIKSEDVIDYKPSGRGAINFAYSLITEGILSSDPSKYSKALNEVRDIVETVDEFKSHISYQQAYCLYRLGKPYLAAQRIQSYSVAPTPFFELMNILLKIELSLHPNGVELESIDKLSRKFQSVFQNLPDKASKIGAAELLTFWHPHGAAFIAMSPYSVEELVDHAMQSIFVDGRPTTVYGHPVPAKLPFVQITLEAFGISSAVNRDQSTERERMKGALITDWWGRPRSLPAIPPALLIFHYIKTAETVGGLWIHAAKELSRSHGIIPKTTGNNLRMERTLLDQLLRSLLDGDINSGQLLKRLSETLKGN